MSTITKNVKYAEHIVKGGMLIFVMSILANLIGYLIRIFLARSLTPTDYGMIYAALSLLGVLNILRNLGFSDTLRKKVPEYLVKNNYIKIKSVIILTSVLEFIYMLAIFTIVFVFASSLSQGLFESIRGVEVLVLLSLSGLVSVFYGIMQSTFQGLHKFRIYTSLDFSIYLLRFIFIIAFIPFGILALPYAYLTTAIIIAIVSFLIFRLKFPLITKAKTIITRKFTKEILYFSSSIMTVYIATSVVSNLDTVLISLFRSLDEVAMYQIALPLANVLLLVSGAITIVLLPTVSELWTKNKKNMISHMLGLITKSLFILVIPLALIMIAFPENVIGMLFGETYVNAASALQILSIGTIFMSLSYIFSSSNIGIGKPFLNTKIWFVLMIVNVVLNFALIPVIGFNGAAISLMITHIFGFIIFSYFARKHTKVRIQWLNMMKIFIGGIFTLIIIFAIKTFLIANPWLELIISLIAGIIFYTLFILVSKSITKQEIFLLKEINLPIPKFLIRFANRIIKER